MSKNLVIVESPSKARTITRILGRDYQVMASMGHVRDLPEKGLGVDVENDFEPVYRLTPSRKKVIGELKKAAKKAEHVYLATDPDREGEAISWHVYEILKDAAKDADFHRVTFHEITRPAVERSFEDPSTIDMDLVNAQQARRVLDRLVGYKVSPLLWRRVEAGTSAGRVQSVSLRLICEREDLIENFTPEEFWALKGQFEKTATAESFNARLTQIDGQRVHKPKGGLAGAKQAARGKKTDDSKRVRIATEDQAKTYAKDAQDADYAVSDVKRKPRKRRPKPPFITSTMQQAASANLRMSPEQTMRVAQQLYEGVDKSGDASGLITYMRTDSVNVSPIAQEAARNFVTQEFGPNFIPPKPNRYRSKKGAQEAHEAIRPTDVNLTPNQARRFLDDRQARLYTLIWNRFVASQMAPAQLDRYTVELTSRPDSAEHAYTFRASCTTVRFPGFMRVYNLEDVDDKQADDEDEKQIPELTVDEACRLLDMEKAQKFTEPPPRFSEATLVRELERNGIGRPSTYASIVNTIKRRKYVDKQKGKLVPTKLGKRVNSYLVENLPSLFQVNFTAEMENSLDHVEQGDTDWVEMLKKFYESFSTWMETARNNTDAPPNEVMKEIFALFTDEIEWKPAEGRRRSDEKFVKSLAKQVGNDKKMTDRQWAALQNLLCEYEDQLPGLWDILRRHEIDDEVMAVKKKREERAKEGPDEMGVKICKLLEQVEEWEEPQGKRGRNDKKFVESICRQAKQRSLTDKQLNALRIVTQKYSNQIPNYDEKQKELELPSMGDGSASATAEEMLKMADEIEKWREPVKGKRRTYDDKAFVGSLRRQFNTKKQLSDRQINALGKVLAKYEDQISDFKKRCEENDLPVKKGNKGKKTGVKCPECGEGELLEKSYRRRTFFGCERYPKCKYTVNSLDKAKESASDEN